MLDAPFMPEGESATLLVRDACVLMCLEHVCLIITPTAVYAPLDTHDSSLQADFIATLVGVAQLHARTDGTMELPGAVCSSALPALSSQVMEVYVLVPVAKPRLGAPDTHRCPAGMHVDVSVTPLRLVCPAPSGPEEGSACAMTLTCGE